MASNIYMEVYKQLLAHFGPRHWWPAETRFEVIVGAILTQQVAWKNVETAIDNLKGAGLLDPQMLLATPDEELWRLIRSTRYYRQKATRLKTFCRVLIEEYRGDLSAFLSLDLPDLRTILLKMHGIGKETADSIILYAAGQPIFVIDAYTHRIFSRLGLTSGRETYDALQERFMSNLPLEASLFNEYHALIVALGHHYCLRRKPRCVHCPLSDFCRGLVESS